jgi:hypothetical protein
LLLLWHISVQGTSTSSIPGENALQLRQARNELPRKMSYPQSKFFYSAAPGVRRAIFSFQCNCAEKLGYAVFNPEVANLWREIRHGKNLAQQMMAAPGLSAFDRGTQAS